MLGRVFAAEDSSPRVEFSWTRMLFTSAVSSLTSARLVSTAFFNKFQFPDLILFLAFVNF